MASTDGVLVPPKQTTFAYITTIYRAVVDGAGYLAGDILREVTQINGDTGAPTGVVNWYNVDQDAAQAARIPA